MRKLFQYRGKKIKQSDKHLLSNFFTVSMVTLFSLVMIPFHLKAIMAVDWETVTLDDFIKQLQTPYFLSSVITALFVCLIVGFLYYYYKIDNIKQLEHRQKLAKMVLQNGWYEAEQIQSEGFFKDLPSSKTKERISHFPKMYYYLKDGLIHINVEITMGKYQDQLLQLENKLETGLYCELVDKELKDSYIEYTLLYDTIASRIQIDEATAHDGRLKLMDSVYWEYDKLPHMLIAGGTGGGKSYFILTIIEALLHTNANLYILDPKNSDLADLATVMDNVYFRKDDMLQCINQFYEDMIARSEAMKQHPNYKTGENYAYLGLPANFLIFDEYVAFMDMLGRDSAEVISKLKQIVMLGRQAGFFLILACQRPDAKYLGDGIRDQFNFRVALGRLSELGYGMMFGSDTQKQFFLKPIKGRGYVDTGTSVISEFYTPKVPKGYDFLKQIGKLANKSLADPVADEVKATGSD
ncbi:ATP-binding protein [Carnobacterium divergens]|uniref:FtsK/SpoIIIE domain-containing protein n=1 Tax=Bacilli TaxID=91061 RepID=UPI000766B131|nr:MULTISPECIES: FtsK/SpoIIIE domain-containing protein [Bacilli]EAC4976896.1 DUF87 domain-containing protein [Listeria monocytogenes]EAC9100653.1 DUF87 domain-containing protein [Listeria monocytogenes]EAD2089389.1 DUF87 domain-containing protein [Listeria monocytogenes]EAE1383927.1 DUF87 domain-containing protein [Listeria monocytogenes]EAE6660380.1 DUF87 domain-containing protein [Listeria monocytogenes]